MIMPWHIYQEAEADGVQVHFLHMEELPSISIPGHIGMDLSKLKTTVGETTAAAHELGHDCTGTYYGVYSTIDCRKKNENAADRYAIQRYIDPDRLFAAMESGYSQAWQLSELFGFTEDFMKKAVCYYTHGNLAAELYF